MTDERPLNWNWVQAVGKCKATVVFGELKAHAQVAVNERNQQLEQDGAAHRYELTEVNGIEFGVGRVRSRNSYIYFKVDDQLREIVVSNIQDAELARYSVRLNDEGACRLYRDNDEYPHWRVLKTALEPLLFQ